MGHATEEDAIRGEVHRCQLEMGLLEEAVGGAGDLQELRHLGVLLLLPMFLIVPATPAQGAARLWVFVNTGAGQSPASVLDERGAGAQVFPSCAWVQTFGKLEVHLCQEVP